jgi:cerevisin
MHPEIQTYLGPKKESSYIVTLKNHVHKGTHLDWLSNHLPTCEVTHSYQPTFLNAYAGICDEVILNTLRQSPDVEYVFEDGIMEIKATVVEQTDAPWGIARLSQDDGLVFQTATDLSFTYRFDSAGAETVDVYVVDTGIRLDHEQFSGRAKWGKTFGKSPDLDDNGHGTHCAGTIAGSQFGVAKNANLIAVKVLDASGRGATSDIIAGMDWVVSESQSTGNPSVVNMSLGGGVSVPLDNAVASLTRFGVHVIVAAGNENQDAKNSSPARAPTAITVGASTINDVRADFSNFGSVVDIFAPGEAITSASNLDTTGSSVKRGTSMATPHVVGLIAYLINIGGNRAPASMKTFLSSLSVKNILADISPQTVNQLARNNV